MAKKKAKKKAKLNLWFEYIFFKGLFFLAKITPFSFNRWVWGKLGLLFFSTLKSRRLLTLENIYNAKERGFLKHDINEFQLAKQAWKHMGVVGSEFLYFNTRTPEQLKKIVELKGEENLKQVLAKGKGAIMVMAHIGNWELLGMYLSFIGYKLSPLVKTQSNELLDKVIQDKRQSVGMKTIPRSGFLRPIIAAFKNNEIVPFLVDQDARKRGIKVNFFGREASIPRGPAEFALRTGTPVIFAYIVKQAPTRYSLVISEELPVKNTGDYEKDLVENTILFIDLIQKIIAEHPTQWLWMHSLWPSKIRV